MQKIRNADMLKPDWIQHILTPDIQVVTKNILYLLFFKVSLQHPVLRYWSPRAVYLDHLIAYEFGFDSL